VWQEDGDILGRASGAHVHLGHTVSGDYAIWMPEVAQFASTNYTAEHAESVCYELLALHVSAVPIVRYHVGAQFF
jgi:hypothetical protein